MKAIMVMFDSLNRHMLPPYGCDWTHAPNFSRLAQRTATFENCYAGSMPCMPARRELHTGRHNFLHRSWGPLEPFDDSMPAILDQHGIHAHLVTDHYHYWEDGGATYHNRYSTYELFRGQEGDFWKARVPTAAERAELESLSGYPRIRHAVRRQDQVNRSYMPDESGHSQTLTFDAGLEFLDVNHAADEWFLQIETFDPHEPFFSHRRYKELYPHDYTGPEFDWPPYGPVTEPADQVEHARLEYAALLSMCDRSLGRVLDAMDEHALWDDTLLIVCTDHGYLLGEHEVWAKNVVPWYDETIHTPLFIWDPRSRIAGERRRSLVQTIDLAPTLLDFFGLEPTPDMQGRPLRDAVASDATVREAALFGSFGQHVNVTDGRHVYMRDAADTSNTPLSEHTLMPTHMRGPFTPEELRRSELVGPLPFTKGVPVLKLPGQALRMTPGSFGTLLFDLDSDPEQRNPIHDPELELQMAQILVERMRAADAPHEQFERLGLPAAEPVSSEHLGAMPAEHAR